MSDDVLAALIGVVGTVLAALITRNQTRRRGATQSGATADSARANLFFVAVVAAGLALTSIAVSILSSPIKVTMSETYERDKDDKILLGQHRFCALAKDLPQRAFSEVNGSFCGCSLGPASDLPRIDLPRTEWQLYVLARGIKCQCQAVCID